MLTVQDLHVNYGAVHALNGVSLTVNDGEIVSLIGANGAGKTTTLRTITGLEKAASGSITFDGVDLRKTEPSKIITHKLAHVPEGRHIFPAMTVEENLEMGAYTDPTDLEKTREEVYQRFPPPAGAAPPAGGHPLGRRAADAGRGPRPYEQAQDDPDG